MGFQPENNKADLTAFAVSASPPGDDHRATDRRARDQCSVGLVLAIVRGDAGTAQELATETEAGGRADIARGPGRREHGLPGHALEMFRQLGERALVLALTRIMSIERKAGGLRNSQHFTTAMYSHSGGLDLYPR